jgi:hypothetical protein
VEERPLDAGNATVLDTGSKYDVAFVPGEPVYVTVASYNRAQVRHSEHIKPVRVMLQP